VQVQLPREWPNLKTMTMIFPIQGHQSGKLLVLDPVPHVLLPLPYVNLSHSFTRLPQSLTRNADC